MTDLELNRMLAGAVGHLNDDDRAVFSDALEELGRTKEAELMRWKMPLKLVNGWERSARAIELDFERCFEPELLRRGELMCDDGKSWGRFHQYLGELQLWCDDLRDCGCITVEYADLLQDRLACWIPSERERLATLRKITTPLGYNILLADSWWVVYRRKPRYQQVSPDLPDLDAVEEWLSR
jgi:hypothetical protein